MNIKRDNFGAINLDKLQSDGKLKVVKPFHKDKAIIIYDKELYYLKMCNKVRNIYNELIAEEIAHDYGIDVAIVDLFEYNDDLGIMSKSIYPLSKNIVHLSEYIENSCNNLEDIWYKFDELFDNKTTLRLMDKLVDIFLFDVLIGNVDRHADNLSLIIDENGVNFLPLYDNENMLASDSINCGFYTLGVDYKDFNSNAEYNILEKFLSYSDYMYLDKLQSKLWIIEEDNFEKILKRVENKIGTFIQPSIRNELIYRMKENLEMIKRVISKFYKKGKKIELQY